MRLQIDPDRCQGHGRCQEIAADLVEADDLGRGSVYVEVVPEHLLEQARAAVRVCPEQAVTLVDD